MGEGAVLEGTHNRSILKKDQQEAHHQIWRVLNRRSRENELVWIQASLYDGASLQYIFVDINARSQQFYELECQEKSQDCQGPSMEIVVGM
jgi:hypothetical protein